MKDRLILFVTDRGFVVPTLVAARQALAQAPVANLSDVLIVLVGLSASEIKDIQTSFECERLKFVSLEHSLASREGVTFRSTHVSEATVARLLTPDLIDARYKHILYLDGDTQIVGDIFPLVSYDVPQGRILAANDRLSFSRFGFGELGNHWVETRDYLESIGVSSEAKYFNAGVLAMTRHTWADVCGKALRFFYDNSSLCRFHDQSALNAVCVGRRDHLSPEYNFSTGLAELVDIDKASPRIVHFTGAKKPWLFSDTPPWRGRFSEPYVGILDEHPFLHIYAQDWESIRASRANESSRQASSIKGKLADWLYKGQNRARLSRSLAQKSPF